MDDGRIAVDVYTVTGRRATLRLRVDDDGRIAFTPPAPGSFSLDPDTDIAPFEDAWEACVQIALERRRRAT